MLDGSDPRISFMVDAGLMLGHLPDTSTKGGGRLSLWVGLAGVQGPKNGVYRAQNTATNIYSVFCFSLFFNVIMGLLRGFQLFQNG